MSTYRVWHRGFFPPNEYFSALFTKKKLKSDFQAHCYSNVYQLSKMLYFSARYLWMRFKLSFYHSTQCRRDAVLHVFGTKKWQERPMQSFVGDLFPHRGKCCGFVQEFRHWGQNPLCSRSYSVTRNKRGIRLMISGVVLSHLTPTDLWRTSVRFLKVSPRISRVKTYLRTRFFFPDCWPWSRWSCLLPCALSLHTCTGKHLKNLRRKILEMCLVSIWDPHCFSRSAFNFTR